MSKFRWHEAQDEIVVQDQAAIAVFRNVHGGITVRQASQFGASDDHWVCFRPEHAIAIAYAILDNAELPVDLVERTERGFVDVPRPDHRNAPEHDERDCEDARLALPPPESDSEAKASSPDLFASKTAS